VRPGNPAGDLGQRAIALAIVVKATLDNGHAVSSTVPFAHQPGAELQGSDGHERQVAIPQRHHECVQSAHYRRAQAAMCLFLELVGDRPDQQIAAQPGRRFGAMEPLPGDLQILDRQSVQTSYLGCDRIDPRGVAMPGICPGMAKPAKSMQKPAWGAISSNHGARLICELYKALRKHCIFPQPVRGLPPADRP
jgi:hypothetical protein